MSHLPVPFFTAVKAFIRHGDNILVLGKSGQSVDGPGGHMTGGNIWVADYLSQRGFS